QTCALPISVASRAGLHRPAPDAGPGVQGPSHVRSHGRCAPYHREPARGAGRSGEKSAADPWRRARRGGRTGDRAPIAESRAPRDPQDRDADQDGRRSVEGPGQGGKEVSHATEVGQWVGGGKTFAAKPRDFTQKVNRKMYRGAIRSMLSELARTERLLVTDGIRLAAPKTRLLAQQLKAWELPSVLIVVEASDEKLILAARNLPHVEVIEVPALNPLSLAAYDKVLMTVGAVKLIEERLQ